MAARYKYNKIPLVTVTNPQESYFGAQRERSRREAKLDEATSKFASGEQSYADFQSTAERVLAGSVGLPERVDIGIKQSDAQTIEYTTQDSNAAGQYARGEISYDEYKNYLSNTLGRYDVGSSQYEARSSAVDQLAIDKTFADITNLTAEFNTGALSYDEYRTELASYLTQFDPSSTQYDQIIDAVTTANQTAVTREYNSAVQKYQNGELSYQDLIDTINGLGTQLQGDIFGDGADQGPGVTDDLLINTPNGETTIGDLVDQITQDMYNGQYEQSTSDYSAGKISFEEYVSSLNELMNKYSDDSIKNQEYQNAWESAYQTELGRYKSEIDGLYNEGKGTMTADEYAAFQNWYADKVAQGPQQSLSFQEFTYEKPEKQKNKSGIGKAKKKTKKQSKKNNKKK